MKAVEEIISFLFVSRVSLALCKCHCGSHSELCHVQNDHPKSGERRGDKETKAKEGNKKNMREREIKSEQMRETENQEPRSPLLFMKDGKI